MRRLIDLVAPPHLGGSFRALLGSQWATNFADGLAIAAGPLLVASETDDARLIAAALALQRVPWLVLGLYAGVIADRVDRRRLMIAANLARSLVAVVLVATILSGSINVAVVLMAMAILGVAEVFVDTTATTLLPMVVEPDDLVVANSRLLFGHVSLNQLAGPAVGAALFGLGRSAPFVAEVVALLLGSVLLLAVRWSRTPEVDPSERDVRREIREGAVWLFHHAPMRTLAITIFVFNLTFGAAFTLLVVLVDERFGLDEGQFGLFIATSAAGAVLGTMFYPRVERALGMTRIMRVGLVIETLTHLVFAWTTVAALAFSAFFVFGIHTSMWGATVNTIRQREVPLELQGRVGAVYLVGLHGGLVVGGIAGGFIAQAGGVTAPYWFAFVGSAVTLAAMWRQLGNLTDERAAASA